MYGASRERARAKPARSLPVGCSLPCGSWRSVLQRLTAGVRLLRGSDPSLWVFECVFRGVADALVADVHVDLVRRRVREVGVEEAVVAAAIELLLRRVCRDGAAVTAPAQARRCVHGADTDAVRRPAAVAAERHGPRLVLPEDKPRAGAGQTAIDR